MQQVQPEELRNMAAYLGPVLTGGRSDTMVRQVPVPFLHGVWPQVSDYISQVIERSNGEWTVNAVADRLLRGDWQLWVVYDGEIKAIFATTLAVEDSGATIATIPFVTGRRAEDWIHLIADIEDWAKDQGAIRLKMTARKGYPKRFKELFASYKMTHVLLEKDL